MEQIDYDKLIDSLCIPSIKILREDLGVETLFCCQGSCKEDCENLKEGEKPKHGGTSGYISVALNKKNKYLFINLYDYLTELFPYYSVKTNTIFTNQPRIKISYNKNFDGTIEGKSINIYLPNFSSRPKKELKKLWGNIENFLKNYEKD